MYEALGIPAAPFPHVQYFAPYTARGLTLNTLRSNAALQHNVSPLTWGLREVMQFAEVLLNKDDIDAKADALIDFIASRVVDQPFSDPLLGGRQYAVRSFADLDGVLPRSRRRDGGGQSRAVAHAPRGDDPQGAQPPRRTSPRAARDWSPTTVSRSTSPSGASRTARCM